MTTYSQQVRDRKRKDTDAVLGWLARNLAHILLTILSLMAVLPLLLIVSSSLTDEIALTRYGYNLIPTEFSIDAYQLIFRSPTVILRAYLVTMFVTVAGTALAVTLMSMLAYALSRPDFWLRKPLSFMVFFTLLFNGGIVPYYVLMTQYLRVQDTVVALILPGLVSAFYVLILRTYFTTIPQDLIDAARVDGAGEFRIFWAIAIPLAKPALATIALFTALNYWNDWTTPLYFIRDPQLFPLQYMLYILQSNIQAAELQSAVGTISTGPIPAQTTRMAMAVLATGPAAIFFLFFQRYLVRGVTLGAFK